MRPEDVPECVMIAATKAMDAEPFVTRIPSAQTTAAAIAAVWPLIAQAERERCAAILDESATDHHDLARDLAESDPESSRHAWTACKQASNYASAIRALPDTGE